MNESRLNKLKALLDPKNPDAFLLYAIALEYKSAGDLEKSIEVFSELLRLDEQHTGAYYQISALYAERGESENAENSYQKGIDVAQKSGNTHALSELKQAYTLFKEGE
jgi:tetratricopeptide (TPR) repeat protein